MTFYIHISDGVYVSKEPKPELKNYRMRSKGIFVGMSNKYKPDLKRWEADCIRWEANRIPVVNAEEKQMTGGETYWQVNKRAVDMGQQVEAEIKDGKAIITSIKHK